MAYEVLARKWRPQRFEDVVGQDHVTRTLRHAIEGKRLAHAYLFVGPRGIGKTSLARIFARALNCGKGTSAEPCGTCDSCREIAAGTNLDVMEIDGASNNGVDQVRDLRDTVRYAPTRGPFKIIIIDEVHMLSTGAFNALLKTLEEPPAHVKFIFATTEPQKVPATVLSRCQRFDLRRIAVPQIVERLRLMAATEQVVMDEDALLAVARGAEGGMRDAQSALDQLIAFKGNHITEADVLSVFGLVSRVHLEALAEAVIVGDVPDLIRIIGELDGAGKDLQRLVIELMEYFRNLLVVLSVTDPESHTDVAGVQLTALKSQAQRTDSARVLRVLQVLTESEDRMKFALSRRTLLETALIRAARAATVVTIEELLAQIQALKAQLGGMPAGPAVAASPAPVRAAPPAAPVAPLAPAAPAPAPVRAVVREVAPPPVPVEAPPAATDSAGDLRLLKQEWKKLIGEVKSVRAKHFLKDARPVSVKGTLVVIGFDAEFPEGKELFETGRDRKALEMTLAAYLKRPVRVEFSLVEPSVATANAAAMEGKPSDSQTVVEPEAGKKRGAKEWAKDPAIVKTLEMFNGTIIDVQE